MLGQCRKFGRRLFFTGSLILGSTPNLHLLFPNSTRWSRTSTDLRAHGNLDWYPSPNQFFSENATCPLIILVPHAPRPIHYWPYCVGITLSPPSHVQGDSNLPKFRLQEGRRWCNCAKRSSVASFGGRCLLKHVARPYGYSGPIVGIIKGVISSTIHVGSAFRQFEGLAKTDHYYPCTFGLSSWIRLKR